jgi:DNA-directed RNA polymerase subunit RPC12/RpoP
MINTRRKKYTIDEVKNIAMLKGGVCLSKEYINNKKQMAWKCGKCFHEWTTCFKSININGQWCPKCSGKLNNNMEIVREVAESRGGKCLSVEYNGNKKHMRWKCGKCSHEWFARFDRVKHGTWCPNCRRSWGERAIVKYLNTNSIEHVPEYILRDCNNCRFDFYLPELNTAIEYDGVQHFGIHKKYAPNEETLSRRRNMDVKKTIYCINKKINLLRISYTKLNHINNVLDIFLSKIPKLMLTCMDKYEYVIKHLPIDFEFLTIL